MIMATLKKNTRDHDARKNMGSAEFFRKQRKERNAARGPQELVTTIVHNADGTDVVKHTRVRD
jgi:hypothetical protein